MKRVFNTGLFRFAAVALLGAIALGGCSSGADTEQNPVTSGPGSGPTYSGSQIVNGKWTPITDYITE